jgi:hypothetical protein
VDSAVDELLLRQVLLEDVVLLLHVQTVEAFRSHYLLAGEGGTVEELEGWQFVHQLEAVIFALL